MSKWYHCTQCNYYWQSNIFEYKCPECGSDAYALLKMTPQHAHRLERFFELIEKDLQHYNQYGENKSSAYQEHQEAPKKRRFSPQLQDNRGEIEKLYRAATDGTRGLIEKSIKHMKVNGNNGDLLRAKISNDGTIEIVSVITNRIVLWTYLTAAERWSFWQQFNNLLEKVNT